MQYDTEVSRSTDKHSTRLKKSSIHVFILLRNSRHRAFKVSTTGCLEKDGGDAMQ